MAFVIRGRLMPLAAGQPAQAFRGRLWIGDDGRVAAVTKGNAAGPPGFQHAIRVDVGTSLVFPGLVDLHNHLAYDTLPLWTEPTRAQPFLHHNSWPGAASYAPNITWPAYALITAAPEELLAYVETKAIVGGTTTIQGSPPKNRPRDGWLVRNAEDETFGGGDPNLVYASTLTLDAIGLANRANRMRTAGSTFIYHCAEGRPGSVVRKEYQAAADAGCLQERFVAVHCNAVDPSEFARWTPGGAVVWSPFSNLWLYGTTTDVPAASAAGLSVCLGSDWAPSGSKHLLGELKVARLVADHLGWGLTDADLVAMVTTAPGDALARSWHRQVGRLQPNAIADVLVVRAAADADPFATLVAATERDVELVVIDGRPRYGTPALMTAAGAGPATTVEVAGQQRTLALSRPDDATTAWAWDDVVARLEEVRADPKREIDAARDALAAEADAPADAPAGLRRPRLRLALDMPTGLAPVGGLPKDLSRIVVPPLEPLAHDSAFFDGIAGRGFHSGLLDKLADFYR